MPRRVLWKMGFPRHPVFGGHFPKYSSRHFPAWGFGTSLDVRLDHKHSASRVCSWDHESLIASFSVLRKAPRCPTCMGRMGGKMAAEFGPSWQDH